MDTFSCQAHGSGTAVVVAVAGDVDLATCGTLAAVAGAQLTPGAQVVLDCSRITFLDSSGLSVLMQLRQSAASAGARLMLTALADPVRRTLYLSGTQDWFEVLPGPRKAPVRRLAPRRAAADVAPGRDVRHLRGRTGHDQRRGC